jgi:hypothetical protein
MKLISKLKKIEAIVFIYIGYFVLVIYLAVSEPFRKIFDPMDVPISQSPYPSFSELLLPRVLIFWLPAILLVILFVRCILNIYKKGSHTNFFSFLKKNTKDVFSKNIQDTTQFKTFFSSLVITIIAVFFIAFMR